MGTPEGPLGPKPCRLHPYKFERWEPLGGFMGIPEGPWGVNLAG